MKIKKLFDTIQVVNLSVKPFDWEKRYIATWSLEWSKINFESAEKVTYDNRPSRASQQVETGDLVFAKMQWTEKTLIIDETNKDYIYSSWFFILRPNDNLDKRYLYQFLRSKSFHEQKDKLCTWATQKALTLGWIKQIQIPLPSLATQRAIADKLDKLQSLIDLKKQAITKTDELAKSIFLEMFGDPMNNEKGWEVVKLGYVSKIVWWWTFKSSDYTQNWIKLVTIKNVHFNKLSRDEITYLPTNIIFDEKFNLKENDVIMAMTRPIIKSLNNVKVVVVRKEDLPCLLNQRVCKFDINDTLISRKFLLSFICTDYFKDKISSYASTSLQPNVSGLDIANTDIPLPPLPLQQKFADIITQIESQKSEHKLALAKLEELYQATMQESFSL